jgi:hypothetical protein
MSLEEFYNQEYRSQVSAAYVSTLQFYVNYNDLTIYDALVGYYEDTEQYAICEGISRAIDFIDDTMGHRFGEAIEESEEEDGKIYTTEEYKRVSRLVFEDIIKEIYERQIKGVTQANRDGDTGAN